MAHNNKTWPAGLTNGLSTLDHTELEDIDLKTYKAINGDDGGSWAPSTAIVIGGSGVDPTLKATKWPNFAADAGAKRTFQRPVEMAMGRALSGGVFDVLTANLTPGFRGTIGMGDPVVMVPLDVPDGATITQVDCRVRIVSGHAALPVAATDYPHLSVKRYKPSDVATYVPAELRAAGQAYFPVPGSVPVYETNGAAGVQTFSYACDQNNVVDRSLYTYWATITDEGSSNGLPGNLYYALLVTFTLPELKVP